MTDFETRMETYLASREKYPTPEVKKEDIRRNLETLDLPRELAYARKMLENKTLEEVRQCIGDLREQLEKSRKFVYTQEDRNEEYKIHLTLDEAERTERTMMRDDLETPHDCRAAYTISNVGTDLDAIEPFTTELTGIVDKMKEEMANETRILEGTEVPEYKADEQNGLSEGESKEDQSWRTVLLNGSWTIVRTHTSIYESSNSSCFARHNSPVSPTLSYGPTCSHSLTSSWGPTWADCGQETVAMNECSECTVPMISELTLGTPSEEK